MTIGLFGTCGGSNWRDDFISRYEQEKINYFNPQKEDWKPEDAEIEAEHLANDEIILFPVLAETSGLGSLGEVGFSILQAIKLSTSRHIVVYIDPNCTVEDEALRKESIRMRALILAHLKKLQYPNVWVAKDMNSVYYLANYLHSFEVTNRSFKEKYTING
jgi:hypothetical protein